jgi:hypothetical protein
MRFRILPLIGILFFPGALTASQPTTPVSYKGLCEASAAVYIDQDHFVVASDETNILRLYARNDASNGIALDLQTATGFDKSDIEAAARSENTVYWISSHSLNSSGEDKKKRKIFFATRIISTGGRATLEWEGEFLGLRDAILTVTGVKKSEINIEGLAATSEGGLLIGLRNTLDDKALVIPFTNPGAVIDRHQEPLLGKPFRLDLQGKGVRSIERIANYYLIIAGPVSDEGAFSLYRWAGGDQPAEEMTDVTFGSLRPEAIAQVPGSQTVQILSDDGSKDCDDEASPLSQRAFRSIDVKIDN